VLDTTQVCRTLSEQLSHNDRALLVRRQGRCGLASEDAKRCGQQTGQASSMTAIMNRHLGATRKRSQRVGRSHDVDRRSAPLPGASIRGALNRTPHPISTPGITTSAAGRRALPRPLRAGPEPERRSGGRPARGHHRSFALAVASAPDCPKWPLLSSTHSGSSGWPTARG
jgi:hypothetical protein